MSLDVQITTSAEDDLEAFTRSQWEVSPIAPNGETVGERKSVAPPFSRNTVVWLMDAPCLVGGVDLWRDGRWVHSRMMDAPMSFRGGDTLTLHYNLTFS